MFPFWSSFIEPALSQLRPRCVIEIGSEAGHTTRHLAEFCRSDDAVLYAVDPAPKFDVSAWQSEFGESFQMHTSLSLRALPKLPAADAVLIDGDHNWYTVFHELASLEAKAGEAGIPFPMTFLHNIDWPYARRDLYYDPATIPAEYRHPNKTGGLRVDSPTLVPDGLNATLNHAVTENTPCNGVRTAIEDYLEQSALELEFTSIPGFHGLGILYPQDLAERHAELSALLMTWRLDGGLADYIAELESARVHLAGSIARQE